MNGFMMTGTGNLPSPAEHCHLTRPSHPEGHHVRPPSLTHPCQPRHYPLTSYVPHAYRRNTSQGQTLFERRCLRITITSLQLYVLRAICKTVGCCRAAQHWLSCGRATDRVACSVYEQIPYCMRVVGGQTRPNQAVLCQVRRCTERYFSEQEIYCWSRTEFVHM
jgi:hypothetical protein